MLAVLVPYVGPRRPEVEAGVPAWAEWVDVSADGHAYWRTMCEWWERGESFLVVEHDVVCRPDVLEAVEACPEPWCTHPYTPICHWECQEAWANMLGCTRFSASLIAACPQAVSSIPVEQRLWNNLCDSIAGNKIGGVDQPTLRPHSLRAAGYSHHWHFPAVRHRSWETETVTVGAE